MSEVKVNKISPRTNCGTVQLGDSGDTFTIPAGATITNNGTQTGFGRTGTVNWDTTDKTASFTAVSGNGYFVNTTSGTITVTLPASPSAGDIVAIKDYTGTFGTNACTVARNSSNIRGGTDNFTFDKNNSGGMFIYVDATEGWQIWIDGSDTDAQASYIEATGGTTTTCGNFKIHTFTGPGTFCVSSIADNPANNAVDYLVVAGGGGAGGDAGGGGGAGGVRFASGTFCMPTAPANPRAGGSQVTVTATAFPITVGGGGPGASDGTSQPNGTDGSNSVFSTITSTGGGGGAGVGGPTGEAGRTGGSGSGSRANSCSTGGAGNTPPVSPSQGMPGGNTGSPPWGGAGGGGGMMVAGGNGPAGPSGGPGGAGGGIGGNGGGFPTAFGSNGESSGGFRYYAGGGAGGSGPAADAPTTPGGLGGGGNAVGPGGSGNDGTSNTGGGGGGGHGNDIGGGNGGSGIVVIRYRFQ